MLKKVTIYTDGACYPNPGTGGWAAILMHHIDPAPIERVLTGSASDTTNNQMEIMAAIQGLSALKFSCHVTLYSDSKYLINGATKWLKRWKRFNWQTAKSTPVANKDLWQRLDAVMSIHTIDWRWVKAHSGHLLNERVDCLAVEARLSHGKAAREGVSLPELGY